MFPTLIKCTVVFSILVLHFLITTKIKKISESKSIKRMICVFTAVITLFLMFTPFENTILQADTPEKVFEYTTVGTIVAKEEGTDSCSLLYKTKANAFSTMILTKNGDKYKKHATFTETINLSASGDTYSLHFYIRRANTSSDYYILIGGEITEAIQITDTEGTQFDIVHQETKDGKTHIYYMEKINYIPKEYKIFVNEAEATVE